MILLMISKVWQVLAETHTPEKKGFGEMRMLTYVEYAAGTCVTKLPASFRIKYPSPPIGPGRATTGPIFIFTPEFKALPLKSHTLSRLNRVSAQIRTC